MQLAEPLEPRCLLAVTPILINDTELLVQLEASDSVTIQADSAGFLEVLSSGSPVIATPTILANTITSIMVTGGDGLNRIDLTGVTTADFDAALTITVNGGDGGDTILGSEFADSLIGGNGADEITGALENDTLEGSNGNDTLSGGVGDDSLLGGDGADSIHGDAGNDTVVAGNGADQVFGDAGLDSLNGGDGSDTLNGDADNDTLSGDNGNDSLLGGTEDDLITGGNENDIAFGGDGIDIMTGNAGNDSLNGDAGTDNIDGGDGIDSLNGGTENDTLNGGTGNDSLRGSDGNDSLLGGAGNDTLFGETGDDTALGQAGNDSLVGGGGTDSLNGGDGNDVIRSSDGVIPVVIPSLTIADFSQAEGNAATTNFVLTVTLSAATTVNVSFTVTTADNIALSGIDFPAVNTVVTVPAGQLTTSVMIPVIGDTIFEANETFFVNLSNPVNGTIADSQATVTVTNDELAAATQIVFVDFDTGTAGNDYVYTPADRTTALNRLAQIHNGLPIQFVGTLPASGPFTRVTLNTGMAGGAADEIDFRNLNPNNSATVDINGILGGGNPPATSANIVELTALVTAHENGHMLGLRHGDSFGPIGTGITSRVANNAYTPSYPGPATAVETFNHIMATPAIGETIAEAISGLFFGEREAVKLSTWAFGGAVQAEQASAHGTTATAQDIALRELFVPNTLVSGANVGQTFRVNELSVTGAIGVGGEVDLYRFSGVSGQLLNIEVLSQALSRLAGTIDSRVRVLDSTGAVIPYFGSTATNDDEFETGDSILIDLTLPSTGTFFIEVTAQAANDTGGYELYAFDFATYTPATGNGSGTGGGTGTGSTADVGDLLIGGNGDDTVVGAEGNDSLNGMAGNDSLVGGSGDDLILGGSGIDTLDGGDGNDMLDGQGGNDRIAGGNGSDSYVWNGNGDGVDTLSSLSGYDRVLVKGSGSANNYIVSQVNGQLRITDGTAALNVSPVIQVVDIQANGGDDTITINALDRVRTATLLTVDGGDGNDTINSNGTNIGFIRVSLIGGLGDDSLTGSSGIDSLSGGDGDDLLDAQGGNDLIFAGLGDDTILGGAGNDRVFAGDGSDSIDAGAGDDSVIGDIGADTINGDDGNDTLDGGDGTDTINGGSGNDSILGGNEADDLNGSTGNDTVRGGANDDTISGENGNDSLFGEDGNDSIVGQDGEDTISGGDGDDTVDGGNGNDLLGGGNGDDVMNGAAGNDTLTGGDGNDTMLGGAGGDVLLGDEGDDSINGQGGIDTINPGEGNDIVVDPVTEIDTNFTLSAALLAALA